MDSGTQLLMNFKNEPIFSKITKTGPFLVPNPDYTILIQFTKNFGYRIISYSFRREKIQILKHNLRQGETALSILGHTCKFLTFACSDLRIII